MSTRVIVIRSNRLARAHRMQAAQHAFAGLLLVTAGLNTVNDAPLLGLFEILASGAMGIAFIKDLRTSHIDKHPSINWLDFFAALVLAGEAWHRADAGARYLPIAYGACALMMVGRAYAHEYLMQRRRLELNDRGFRIRMRRFSLEMPWSRLDAADIKEDRIELTSREGQRHVVDLRDMHNSGEVRKAFAHHIEKCAPMARQPAT